MHPAHEWFRERYDRIRKLFADWIADDQRRGLSGTTSTRWLASRTIIAALDGLSCSTCSRAAAPAISAPLELYVAQLRST